jgi:hypothetical protein
VRGETKVGGWLFGLTADVDDARAQWTISHFPALIGNYSADALACGTHSSLKNSESENAAHQAAVGNTSRMSARHGGQGPGVSMPALTQDNTAAAAQIGPVSARLLGPDGTRAHGARATSGSTRASGRASRGEGGEAAAAEKRGREHPIYCGFRCGHFMDPICGHSDLA